MDNRRASNPSRRFFLTRAVPICALACFGAKDLFAMAQSKAEKAGQEAAHKFDSELGRTLTLRQYYDSQFREYIQLAKALEAEWGKDKTTEFLKKITTKKLTEYGKRQASQSEDNSFQTYVKQFRSGLDKWLTLEIVEDTDIAFELKVTECIWADTFLRADAGHIGYCSVYWGDYAWAEGFNKNIKMVRDKTLMQGHDYCNHRYLWTA